MADTKQRGATGKPGFVVLKEFGNGQWRLVGEANRQPGRTARAARTQAIMDATKGKAKAGDVYAAVLRSEWRIAQDW
jgi:hypothetical protein